MFRTITDAITKRALEFTGGQGYLTIQLNITNACNLRCVHCYHPHHKNDGSLSLDDWKKILDQYGALTQKLRLAPAITFCGGEPMTSPFLKQLIEDAARRWPTVPILILTNGTVRRWDLDDIFMSHHVRFQVSMDGPDAQRHDQIRGKGNFDRTLQGICALKELGFRVHLLSILSKKTSQWIGDFFDLATHLGVVAMNFTRFIPEGYGEKLLNSGGDRPLEAFELRTAMESIVNHSRRSGIETNTRQALFHLIDASLGRHDMGGFQGLIVDYKGNLKFSSRSSFILGNVLEQGLESLFLGHPLMRSLRNGEVEGCGSCQFYTKCGGNRTAAFAATGSFLAPDPGCWFLEEKKTRRYA